MSSYLSVDLKDGIAGPFLRNLSVRKLLLHRQIRYRDAG
jgi:hypothetical protein